MQGGEDCKNDPAVMNRLLKELNDQRIDRHSYVVAIGGGAWLDAVGYAAAITHRGVRLVRVPTTVLSQADSGVGVKNGINHFGKKNFLGTFAPPAAVFNDSNFLETLPRRDAIAGMAEAVKVALIRDATYFEWLCDNRKALAQLEGEAVQQLIRRTAGLHLRHIGTSGDPFENGSARPLDFGHWAAHKLESMTQGPSQLRHGEAVAIGIALDTHYSMTAGLLRPDQLEKVAGLLEGLGLTLWSDALTRLGSTGQLELLEGLDEFREHLGGELTITLLETLGQGVEVHQMDPERVVAAIDWLRARHARR
jgi:3-dehydroquinate synthase